MSRWYGMKVTLSGFVSDRIDAIKRAAGAEWDLTEWEPAASLDDDDNGLESYAEGSLCGTETEFTARLTHVVWLANGAYCQVTVTVTCLENLPYEIHCLDEDDYAQWRKTQRRLKRNREGSNP